MEFTAQARRVGPVAPSVGVGWHDDAAVLCKSQVALWDCTIRSAVLRRNDLLFSLVRVTDVSYPQHAEGHMSAPPADEISALRSLPASELRSRWREHLREEPPSYSRRLLVSRLAYRLQAQPRGGLSRATQKAMDDLLARAASSDPGPTFCPRVEPVVALAEGAALVREWRGDQHEVHVVSNGFVYRDRRYASLTAIAFAVTGMHRSGPAFFGIPAAPRGRPPGAGEEASDLALAVARAYHWCALVEDHGRALEALAIELGLPVARLEQRLRIAFLAPDIVEDIISRPRERGPSLRDLLDLPLGWPSQRQEALRLGLQPDLAAPVQAAPTPGAKPGRSARHRASARGGSKSVIRAQLEGLIDRHAVARDLRAGTVQCYRTHIPVVIRFCEEHGIRRLQDWTRDHGLAFVTWMSAQPCISRWPRQDDRAKRPWSATRINLVLNLARLAFHGLQETGEIGEDPLRGVRNRRKEHDTTPVYLSDGEVQALLEACDLRQGLGCRDFLITAVCLCVGLRPSELCRVRRCDLQGSRLTVPAFAAKVRKTHTLLLPEDPQQPGELDPELRRPLMEYLSWRAGRSTALSDIDPLFVNLHGLPLTPNTLYQNCKHQGARAGLPPRRVSIYVLRQTCAVRALKQSNWDTEFVRRLLRHGNVSMTQRYLKLLDKDFEERARRVDMLGGISLPSAGPLQTD
jgi:integrase